MSQRVGRMVEGRVYREDSGVEGFEPERIEFVIFRAGVGDGVEIFSGG